MADIDLSDPSAPRSPQFDDFYFQPGQGIEQSRLTFLNGCNLPEAWQDQSRFVIAETGFGTGLNFLLSWQQWRRNRLPGRCLHYLSVEAYPLDREQLEIALSPWPELKSLARQLVQSWPPTTPGYHRIVFPEDQLFLTLMIGDATEQLTELEASVDAWYLDGFAPARNPDMWSPALFAQVARLSRPATRLATHNVGAAIRNGLQEAGFVVRKTTGSGSKRQSLVGCFEGQVTSMLPKWYQQAQPTDDPSGLQATIIGGGLAGASLCNSLGLRSIETRVIDPGLASASDNPRANVMPRLSLDVSLSGRFFWSAFLHATTHWRSLPGWQESGTLVLAKDREDQQRQATLLRAWQLPESLLRGVDAKQAQQLAGIPLENGGLWFAHAGTIAGKEIRNAWIKPEQLSRGLAGRISNNNQRWQVHCDQGELLGESDLLFLANGPGAAALLPHLPFRGFAGQASWLPASRYSERLQCTLINGRYLTKAQDGQHLIGSTFDRCDLSKPININPTHAHAQNLAALKTDFPNLSIPNKFLDRHEIDNNNEFLDRHDLSSEMLDRHEIHGWSGVRCSTPDHLPLAGPLIAVDAFVAQFKFLRHSENFFGKLETVDHRGLFGLLALGSRAFTSAPLAAELVISQALGEPWPMERSLALALHPSRFLVRDLKRHQL